MFGGDRYNPSAPTARRLGQSRLGIALALAALANRAYSVALVVYVYDATHSTAWVAAAAVARYLPGVATSSVSPRLIDRYPPRAVMVTANVCCALALAAMAIAVIVAASPAVPIALAAVVRAIASTQPPAAARLLPVVAGGRDLSHVAARQGATDKLMLLAGPAIGGLLLLVIDPAVELFGLAVVVTAAAIVSIGLPAPPAMRLAPWRSDTRPPVHTVRAHAIAGIGMFVAFAALAGFIYGTDTVLLAVLSTRLNLGDAGYGELFAGLGAGGVLAAPLVNRLVRQHRLAGWLALAAATYSLPSVIVVHTHGTAVVVGLEAVRGIGALALDIVATTELQRIVLPQGLPLLTARLTSISFGAVAFGALCTPPLLDGIGTTATFSAVGLIPPILALAAYPALRQSDLRTAQRIEQLQPRIEVLEPLDLLQATSRPVLERLAADVTELVVGARKTVVAENEPSDAFYVILSGDLNVTFEGRKINDLHAGDWFGEIGLLEGLPRTATVRTRNRCELYRISGAAFLEAFAQLPPSPNLLDSVAARLASSQPYDSHAEQPQIPIAAIAPIDS